MAAADRIRFTMARELRHLHQLGGDVLSRLRRKGNREYRMRLSFPLVAGAVVIGVISGNVIFGPPLQKYWAEKQQQEAAKEGQTGST
ncbi:hypothetical protein SORBI_3001G139001 [Sorghum bicolor]|uniref:Uncharacterized protein n=2 Tax=Sorghum bicolor TaxID=4558 RepID=A0A1Z5S633_SORBI|nr:hypothetical protein SORBI_3001G139001 [Sorghum bicolor]